MSKTLIGKEGWLFLQNDSAKELEVHCDNLQLASGKMIDRFQGVKENYLLTVFPNKSLIMKQFLPDGFDPKFRPAFDKYAEFLKSHILDGLSVLLPITDTLSYYKTDTHINTLGAYLIYRAFVHKVNEQFGFGIAIKDIEFKEQHVASLSDLQLGIGDLTWNLNLGPQKLETMADLFYDSPELEKIYMNYVIAPTKQIQILNYTLSNVTSTFTDSVLDWGIISKHILYQHNSAAHAKKVLIFFDSFLLSTLSLYLTMFSDVFLAKCVFNKQLVDQVNPDYIFEFRVERFLL